MKPPRASGPGWHPLEHSCTQQPPDGVREEIAEEGAERRGGDDEPDVRLPGACVHARDDHDGFARDQR
jgi:hypothetical protein